MKRLKVLMSAYACEPGMGSEPGVGWDVACEMAKHHDIWVITRANNREVIEAELVNYPVQGLHFVYYDLPKWSRWWKKVGHGVQLYYYLWQLGIYPLVKKLHREVGFNLAHHVTFVKYWVPSLLALLPIPFLWGPVGGGESAPKAFRKDFSPEGQRYERLRDLARWLVERDPLVRRTARKSKMALVTTKETYEQVLALWAGCVKMSGECALSTQEIDRLKGMSLQESTPIRFISMGRLLQWKGFHLGLRAFAQAGLANAEYWIIGDGPERGRLEGIAQSLGMESRLQFWGKLPRYETLAKLGQCSMLVHPSLHDSGGWVCLEAMAAGKPVICLDLGGPAVQVTKETGFKIPAHNPEQAVRDMAEAMKRLAENQVLRERMGEAGRQRVQNVFSWAEKSRRFNQLYEKIAF
jgi:glycosyltransferase involved in cell wall biosynthesis